MVFAEESNRKGSSSVKETNLDSTLGICLFRRYHLQINLRHLPHLHRVDAAYLLSLKPRFCPRLRIL